MGHSSSARRYSGTEPQEERTAEATPPRRPVRTVGDLIAALQQLPPDVTLALVCGYEGGFTPIAALDVQRVQEIEGLPDWLGRFQTIEDAHHVIEDASDGAWHAGDPHGPVPRLVGDPLYAVTLRR